MAENAVDNHTMTAVGQGPADEEVLRFLDAMGALAPGGEGDGNLICILQDIQERFGYLPARALEEVARRLHVPLSRVYAVVSFYAQLYTEPRGRHTVRCCRGTACHVKGADRVLDMVRRTLGIDDGQTTPDMMFYLETIACLGTCFLAPAMMIDGQYYGKLTPRRVEQVLSSYRTEG
ncbi:MAG TPA: NADH-quinone oxidoreductase subunit NuoE [Phycisphaerae bacterium]|nr:NADH-quinone oxidoreductase subunit NuoE [Phycisphaerae bacterium]